MLLMIGLEIDGSRYLRHHDFPFALGGDYARCINNIRLAMHAYALRA